MKLRRKQAPLYLRINAFRAADLFLPDGKAGGRSVSACLVALLNSNTKRCKRKLNTPNPSWDDEIVLPLKDGDYSDLLVLAVWNWTKRDRVYLGEARFKLSELFDNATEGTGDCSGGADSSTGITDSGHSSTGITDNGRRSTGITDIGHSSTSVTSTARNGTLKTDAQWFKLFSSAQRHEYITGSVLVLFEIFDKKDKSDNVSQSTTKLGNIPQNLWPVDDILQKLNITGSSLHGKYKKWLDSLLLIEETPAVADDQGFYADLPFNIINTGADVSDMETLSELPDDPKEKEPINVKHLQNISSLSPLHAKFILEATPGGSTDSENYRSDYTSGSDVLSIESANLTGPATPEEVARKKHHRRKRSLFKKKTPAKSLYELRNRKVEGVLFMEIVSCSDLPPIKNFSRTSFDMDPFVVVSFGKTTFRTSWKRHTLKPIYNERLAFEIMEHEVNYNIHFSVMDKDNFSFHDQVGEVKIPVADLMEIAKDQSPANDPTNFIPLDIPYQMEKNISATSLGSMSASISFAENSNLVRTRRKRLIRQKTSILYVDTSLFQTLDLKLDLVNQKMREKHAPTLKVRVRYLTYERLRKDFWRSLIEQYCVDENQHTMDYIEFISFLDTLGCASSDEIVGAAFAARNKSTWSGDTLTFDEIVDSLEHHVNREEQYSDEKIFEIEQCPICGKKNLSKKVDLDIITHFAICASKDWSIANKLLVSSYVTPQVAARRWFSKVLIKLSYGKYQLGENSANILVQDRSTGLVLEEKMGINVRLGIRLLYKGLDRAKSKSIRALLRKLSIKQGIKFDHPLLARDIASFIHFHGLDLSDCLVSDYTQFKTFNEFFYRKLQPNARPIESPDDERIAVSPADCRCTTFATVDDATTLWIKGRNFSVAKLFNGNFNNLEKTDYYKSEKCSVGIFRLAPQDYHRFHSPVTGKIGPIKYIEGEYYTVNPMAIRSDLDVYGENVRVIVPIESKVFGTVIMVGVGAMMVGSTVLTVEEGQDVKRGDEIGYFKFGGSTILLLFQKDKFLFDSDLLNNSKQCIETLVRVGQSIGHDPEVKELKRTVIKFEEQSKNFQVKLIWRLTGGDLDGRTNLGSWESQHIKLTTSDVQKLQNEADNEEGENELGKNFSNRKEPLLGKSTVEEARLDLLGPADQKDDN